MDVTVNGARLHVEVSGPADGPVLIAHHGGGGIGSLLPAVTAPTLVTVGRHDWVTPVSSSETIAALLPDAELVVFENSGHSPQVEEAELWRATVRSFLDRVVPAPALAASA